LRICTYILYAHSFTHANYCGIELRSGVKEENREGSEERYRNFQRRSHGTKWQGRIVEVAEEEEEKKKQRRRIRGKWQRSSRGSIMGELGKWQRRAREVAEGRRGCP
jgi:hypothetical protein